MKNKFISLLMAMLLLFTPVLAEDVPPADNPEQSAQQTAQPEEPAQPEQPEQPAQPEQPEQTAPALSPNQQKQIIYSFAHTIANSYYYGVSDNNLLYAVICETIENNGVFDIDLAIKAMVEATGDEFAEFYPADSFQEQVDYFGASFYGLGVVLAPKDGGTVIDSVYAGGSGEEAGLKAGDIVVAVDGIDTSAMLPAEIRDLVSGEENTSVEVTVQRGEERITVKALRRKVSESHSTMELLDNKIAYIDVNSFTASLPDDFDKYIAQMNAEGVSNLIIDLRDNGGGDLDAAISVAKKLIPAGLIGKTKNYKGGIETTEIYSENTSAPKYNILVLVNENTASASEFLAMALQSSGRGKLMGVKTYGKGSMQALMRTPTGSGIKFTVGEYFSPKDERIHTVGLTPDIVVENTEIRVNPEEFSRFNFLNMEDEVNRLAAEQRLNAMGLLTDAETDGVFDEETTSAIQLFQNYFELETNGSLDLYTAIQLDSIDYNRFVKVIDNQTPAAKAYFEK